MTSVQWWLGVSVQVAVMFTLCGLVFRDEARRHWTLTAYLLTVFTCGSLVLSNPETFFRHHFFVLKESLYSITRVAVAVQLAYVVFAEFPGARRSSRLALLIGLVLSTLYIGLSPAAHSRERYPEWHAQVLAATIWLMAGTAVLVQWYVLPVEPLHRVVLLGFSLYLLTFTTTVNALSHFGVRSYPGLGLVDGLAYLGMILWWGVTVWRTDGERVAVAA